MSKENDSSYTSTNSDTDFYGFSKNYNYDRTLDYGRSNQVKFSWQKTLLIIFSVSIICFFLLSATVSGYYAWNEIPDEKIWTKLVRLWIAVVYSPVYIFYIFVKTTVFKDAKKMF